MHGPKVVLDTNVLVAGLRSRQGASFKLLSLLGKGKFEIAISVPLVVEYEDVLKRKSNGIKLSGSRIDDILDYICKVANHREIYYLWRPFLRDPKDDMVLELAVESGSQYIVTFNKRDFKGSERFGVEVILPQQLLALIGEII